MKKSTSSAFEGIEDEGERAIIRVLDNILSQQFELPVFVLNDGDAAAVQTSVDMGLPKTLSISGGTGLAMGYGSTELLTEGGNVIIYDSILSPDIERYAVAEDEFYFASQFIISRGQVSGRDVFCSEAVE